MLLDDLPGGAAGITKHFGISIRTYWNWRSTENAPRPAMLALYWESRWGRSQADTSLFNEAHVHREHAKALQRENEQLRALISELQAVVPETANQSLFSLTASLGMRTKPHG